jgi:hypothetical protein
VALAGRGQIVDARGGEGQDIPIKIATVRREGVTGQPALDAQVVEVGLDLPRQPQLSTSASGRTCMPCASATGP